MSNSDLIRVRLTLGHPLRQSAGSSCCRDRTCADGARAAAVEAAVVAASFRWRLRVRLDRARHLRRASALRLAGARQESRSLFVLPGRGRDSEPLL